MERRHTTAVRSGHDSSAQGLLLQSETFQVKITEEEAKIRAELEDDIEKDLEEEIKGQMRSLALRLHRLHQQRKNKQIRDNPNNPRKTVHNTTQKKNNGIWEIKISINKEGKTKVEIIKDIKKPYRRVIVPFNHVHNNNNNNNKLNNNRGSNSKYGAKKFEWTKSLRSGPPKSSIQVVRNKDPRFPGQTRGNNNNKVVSTA